MPPKSQDNNNNNNRSRHKVLVRLELAPIGKVVDSALANSIIMGIMRGDCESVQALVLKNNVDLFEIKNSAGKNAIELALEMIDVHKNSLQIVSFMINTISTTKQAHLTTKFLPLLSEHIKKLKTKESLFETVELHAKVMAAMDLSSAPKETIAPGRDVDIANKKRDRNAYDDNISDIDDSQNKVDNNSNNKNNEQRKYQRNCK